MTRLTSISLLCAIAAATTGCLGGDSEGPEGPPDSPTWHQDVAPIVAAHCQSCHSPGNIAPFSLVEYEEASSLSNLMLSAIESGTMPPWDAVGTDDCSSTRPWQHDPRLSETQVATIRDWVAAGSPEGAPVDAAPLPEFAPSRLVESEITHRLAPRAGYVTEGTEDEFICFVLDPGLTEDAWLTGLQLNPGNLEVVHHATLTSDPNRESLALMNADGYFPCFGGLGAVTDAQGLGVWTPGADPMDTPDVGIAMTAGSLVIMQIHYHPLGPAAAPDTTTVDMRITPTQPENRAVFVGLGNAFEAPLLLSGPGDRGAVEFRIPAEAPDHLESMRFPVPIDGPPGRYPILGVWPHMHYIGTEVRMRINRNGAPDEPASECLFATDQWDFDWQRVYRYDTPVDELPTVGPGDVIDLDCRYNNTMSNPGVRRALSDAGLDQPIDVVLGEDTLDEMCVMGVWVLY